MNKKRRGIGSKDVNAKVLWSMTTAVRLEMETSAVTTMVLANHEVSKFTVFNIAPNLFLQHNIIKHNIILI